MKFLFLDGQPVLWAGTEASFEEAIAAQRAMMSSNWEALVPVSRINGDNGLPSLIEKRGDIGILNISGRLVDGAAGYGRFFGYIGYDEIATAAIALYSDPDVAKVMVRIESPGGMVDGIFDCGGVLEKFSSTKPSMVYTGTQCCSGGYWLACAIKGAQIVAGPTASVGSIGVLSVHTDITKALEDAGIKKTVLRSGENKARLNPFEPLAPEVKANELAKMADVHGMFRGQVGRGRPNLSTEELLAVTDGSTFLGKRAKAAGLVDSVASFEQALKLLDSQKSAGNTPSNSKGAIMKLSAEQHAKLAAGVKLSDLGLSVEDLAEATAELEAAAKQVSDAAAETAAKTAADAAAAEAAKKAAGQTEGADAASKLVTASAQVDLLTKQLADVNEKLVAKTAEFQNLQTANAPLQANHDALLKLARAATGKLQIALNSPNVADTFDVATVVSTYDSLSTKLVEQFKIGGVTKPVVEDKPKTEDAALAAFRQTAELAQQHRAK